MLSLLQTDDVYFEVPIILKRIKKPSENCKSLWPFLVAIFYFDLNLISACCKFFVIIITFFSLYLWEIYIFICLFSYLFRLPI